tara:strand:+ start:180 stop:404 length:225 start_codon:yes stop_codon:yes gene_type:complete
MKSKEEIIACLHNVSSDDNELKQRDNKSEDALINKGWCEALEWVLHKEEPIVNEHNDKWKFFLNRKEISPEEIQ